ncbi:MAG: sugar phosphate isomerase/epimerase [Planctomycetota bacterium]|nr:sugar phosphate isomerase/epimerase [Planctomycetota bacterium]
MSETSYSTLGFSDRSLEAALDAIADTGFDGVEILGQAPHLDEPPQGNALKEFRGRLEGRGFRSWTVHAPAKTNVPGAPDEDWRQESVAKLQRYVRFSGDLGSRGLIVHPVPNPIFVSNSQVGPLHELMQDAVRRSLDELVPVAAEVGTCILLENLPYHCDYPLLSMRELRPLVDEYPAEQVALILDTGHAWTIGNDPVAEIHFAGTRLQGTHLQDVDGATPNDDHWVPTHGGLDWDAIRAALAEINYAGNWTFEAVQGRHGESPDELARMTRRVATVWGR